MAMEEDPLLLAKAMLTSESKVEEAMRISMLPWLTFVGSSWLFLYCYEHLPSLVLILLNLWVLMCISTLLAITLRPKASTVQGKHGLVVVLSLLGLILGAAFGYWNYARAAGVGDYWASGAHQHYTDVNPRELADAHRDAGVLVFQKDSRPDARLSTAYVAWGQKYCVAPIMSTGEYAGAVAAQYFATGKDCCKEMQFTCGEALDEGSHAGLVIFNKTQAGLTQFFKQDLDYYLQAAKMASARYGVELAEEPIFLTWVGDSDLALRNLWPQARNAWLLLSMLALPAFVLMTLAIEATRRSKAPGIPLFKESAA